MLKLLAESVKRDGKRYPRTLCMIKIFRGGRGVDTFRTPSTLRTTFAFTHSPVFRCFWKDPLMTPHHPTSSIVHCYPPSLSTTPSPLKNFDHTHSILVPDEEADSLGMAKRLEHKQFEKLNVGFTIDEGLASTGD